VTGGVPAKCAGEKVGVLWSQCGSGKRDQGREPLAGPGGPSNGRKECAAAKGKKNVLGHGGGLGGGMVPGEGGRKGEICYG